MKRIETIVIDFDGTCVTHDYPRVGKEIGAIPVLKRLVEEKYKLVLFTMRSGKELDDAVNWFETNGIALYGIQTNPAQKAWTTSPKAYGQLYIDDAALGAPLILDPSKSHRVFIDWETAEQSLEALGILSYKGPITEGELKTFVHDATEKHMNGETIDNIIKGVKNGIYAFEFELDTPYSDNIGSVEINTIKKTVKCTMPESHEHCGIENDVVKAIKSKLGYE